MESGFRVSGHGSTIVTSGVFGPMLRAGASLLVLALVASIPAAAARGCGPAVVQVTVLDQGGTALGGLAPSDFKVRIKNQTANVAAMSYGVFPHSTVLLLSHSGSMSESLKIEMAKRLAAVISAHAPGTVLGGSYGADVANLMDARSGDPFAAGLAATDEKRNIVYDAVIASTTRVAMHHGDAIVLFTDSPDNGSKATAADLRQRLAATGVRLFVIAIPPATSGGTMQPLTDLADASGGGVLVPLGLDATTKGIVITLSQIDSAVANLTRAYPQYNNAYQLETDQEGQDKPLPLRVEVDRRKLGSGKVVVPAVVAPCSAPGQ
jgi:hypothetical protein